MIIKLNKPGTTKEGAIPKAQKEQFLKIFQGGSFAPFKFYFVAKYEKTERLNPFGDIRNFSKKNDNWEF